MGITWVGRRNKARKLRFGSRSLLSWPKPRTESVVQDSESTLMLEPKENNETAILIIIKECV